MVSSYSKAFIFIWFRSSEEVSCATKQEAAVKLLDTEKPKLYNRQAYFSICNTFATSWPDQKSHHITAHYIAVD